MGVLKPIALKLAAPRVDFLFETDSKDIDF